MYTRNDPPPTPDEIHICDGTRGTAPVRVLKQVAVRELLAAQEQTDSFEAEIAKRRAKLAAAKASAVEIQNRYEELLATRSALITRISTGRRDLEVTNTKLAELEAFAELNFDKPLADVMLEHGRREFMSVRLTRWLPEWEAKLVALDEQIAAFRAEHFLA